MKAVLAFRALVSYVAHRARHSFMAMDDLYVDDCKNARCKSCHRVLLRWKQH